MAIYLDRPVFDYTRTKYKATKDSRRRDVHAYRIAQRIGGRTVASVSAFLTLIGMGRKRATLGTANIGEHARQLFSGSFLFFTFLMHKRRVLVIRLVRSAKAQSYLDRQRCRDRRLSGSSLPNLLPLLFISTFVIVRQTLMLD